MERFTTAPVKPSAQTQTVLTAMEENSGHLKSLLEQVIKRFDDQAVLTDKRHEDQTTFNAKVALELQSIRKQLDLTHADVDEARQAAAPGMSPTAAQSQISDARGTVLTAAPLGARSGSSGHARQIGGAHV